ncbi:endoplasmic reticulum-based factor for assembly of V-ATPase-domain-containing protein [Piptocephalis cylindrospora]|uniref:Endoplasmic reticulum-based factor for assembly of V-ATPase-domain-containing protein n=1 Tax=Piptocephalis cylindrospora TaxID=1907219 RepID=A0A4P9Y0Z3_9FUNG|nr:endoplasmic reticulum-based factor for assembly of V-ATPase-domain-containing protein [Piptocephalis cylindrospora]|eukprot:RKP11731.1 endoplasmic reticulum-based factor for assembly of V-ATPase-domain-containing protein [Piptocephalis cylindrospora]
MPSILILVTPRIDAAARKALIVLSSNVDFCLALRRRLPFLSSSQTSTETQDASEPHGIPFELLEDLSKHMLAWERGNGQLTKGNSDYFLHELLRGSRIFSPKSPALTERSEELSARLDRIQTINANAEYTQMVQGILPHENESIADIRSTNQQLAAILNVFFSVMAVATAVYWVSATITSDVAIRVLLSLTGALIILSAEVWFFVRYETRRGYRPVGSGDPSPSTNAMMSPSIQAFVR